MLPTAPLYKFLSALLTIVGVIAACLTAAAPAQGFFSRGVIDGDLGYSGVEIYKDQEDYWGGTGVYVAPRSHRRGRITRGWSGSGFYSQDEYYLTGSLENLSNRTRRDLRVVFYGSDCIRDRTHWTVTVTIDRIDPHQSVPFRNFISYAEPKFPCRFRFHVSEAPAPPPAPPAGQTLPPPIEPRPAEPIAANPPPPAERPPDMAPIYKWVDENGVSHFTNRPVAPGNKNWQPAWDARRH